MIIENEKIQFVGPDDGEEVAHARVRGAAEIDVNNSLITPGFIDGHVHILHFGQSLGKLSLTKCKTLDQIRSEIRQWATSHPNSPRILCNGWLQSSTNGDALAGMVDDLDARPIYIEALDMHSVWCSTSALVECGATSVADPDGGTIHRDQNGCATGLLSESAFHEIVIPFLTNQLSMDEKHQIVLRAFTKFSEAGYTGVIDMGMDSVLWTAMDSLRKSGHEIPLHIAAYWLVPYSETEADIQKQLVTAVAMKRDFHPSISPSFCVTGVKLIADGVVDGCTAALRQPYGAKKDPVEPIWEAEKLAKVVAQADAAGLQCAIHAIGDRAITQAIDAYTRLKDPGSRRHRIEHLELASAEDAKRLGKLGIIASVQPVHSDPAYFKAWPSLLGSHRCKRAFAYSEFLDAGAPTAFGTDTPTATHLPLANLYVATTRRSVVEPECPDTTNPQFAVSLSTAIKAATSGAAYTRYADTWTGSLKAGMAADFVILDTEWDAAGLLQANVWQTWFKGRKVFESEAKSTNRHNPMQNGGGQGY